MIFPELLFLRTYPPEFFGLCLCPHLLLHETHFLKLLVMLLMLSCNGQNGIRLLFIPKEGITPSLELHGLGTLGRSPTPVVLEAPRVLILGRPIPLGVRGSWVLVSSWEPELIGHIREMRKPGEGRVLEKAPPTLKPWGVTAPIFFSASCPTNAPYFVMTQFLPSPRGLSQQH